MHMHQSLSKLTPTCFLGSHSASTSTHSTTNESISWYHSFHCCQTPSISPFLTVSTEQRGSSEIESEVRVWNIQTVQRLRVSYLLYSSWIMAFGCRVAVPGWNWRDWRRELDSFWSLCMWSDLAFIPQQKLCFQTFTLLGGKREQKEHWRQRFTARHTSDLTIKYVIFFFIAFLLSSWIKIGMDFLLEATHLARILHFVLKIWDTDKPYCISVALLEKYNSWTDSLNT